jgi:hypothetical protein
LLITKFDGYLKWVVERLPSSPSGLYYTCTKPTENMLRWKPTETKSHFEYGMTI